MKKKIIALALTALLALSVFALPALADEPPSGGGSVPQGPAKETGEDGNAYVFGFEGQGELSNGNAYAAIVSEEVTTETFDIAAGYYDDPNDTDSVFHLVTLDNLNYTVTAVSLVENEVSDGNTVSLQPWDQSDTPVLSLAIDTPQKQASITIYEKGNHSIDATLTVTVSYNGRSQSFYMNIWRVMEKTFTVDATDTDKLNRDLAAKAADAVAFLTEHRVAVVNVTASLTRGADYGDIEIPSAYGPGLFLTINAAPGDGIAPKVHSIRLESGAVVDRIMGVNFVGTGKEGTGLSGGPVNDLSQCSFTGYATAVAMNAGQVNTQGCTFTGNTTALEINFTQTNKGSGWQPSLAGNTFLSNDTAVKIAALPGAIRYNPYYLRFTNNDFAGNTTDFDVSRRGDYYFYENYFGTAPGESQALTKETSQRRNAVIKGSSADSVHWLPAWKYPVMTQNNELYYGESRAELVLLNDYARTVPIPAASLTNRSIEVVTDDGKDAGAVEKATWTFTNGGE